MEFEAKLVGACEEDDVLTLAFADESPEPFHQVMIQRIINPDWEERERRDGYEKYCVVLGEQARTEYGEFEEVVLSRDRLSLKLDPRLAKKFGTDRTFEIRFADPSEHFTVAEGACRRLFDDRIFRIV